jgi:hypothetical protein|tara:strand:+ start:327 stop:980 length:654 start_codon:yes stop_codon:yes gene_type:complete
MKRSYDLIYFIGDSFTYAIKQADDLKGEVTIHNRFSQLVADHYKLEHVNHAIAGSSNEFIARTLQDDMIAYNIEDKNPLVVVSYTDTGRHEMWDNKLGRPDTCNPSQSWYKDWIVDGYNNEHSIKVTQYHMNACRFLLKYLGYDFVEIFTAQDSIHFHRPLTYEDQTCDQSLVEAAGYEHGCFKGQHTTGGSIGHLNINGNRLVADTLIKQIDKVYG